MHDDEVDRVGRVVLSGPALHAGTEVDQLSALASTISIRCCIGIAVSRRVGVKIAVQPILAHLRLG